MSPVTPRKFKLGYVNGKPLPLEVEIVEGTHYLARDLAPRLRAALEEARKGGLTVTIDSAWRTFEEQRRLHDGWKQGLPGFKPADPPGYSKHQAGRAVDLKFETAEGREHFARAIAPRYGFTRPIVAEPWHFLGTADPVVT